MAALTPSSDKSIYFDAPLTHFHMSSPAPQHPANGTTDVASVDQPNTGASTADGEDLGWLPATDLPAETNGSATRPKSTSPIPGAGVKRSGSGVRRSGSRRSLFTNTEGQPVEGSTFIGGAATTGPNSTAEADEQLHFRAASADASLTPKQRSKIVKSEAKDNKRLSKVIKEEAKAEKQALSVALTELAHLQKLQAAAIKNEAKAQAAHTKIQADFQKHETVFLAARTKYEAAQARLNSSDETAEIIRNNAREATEKLQEKSQEVDSLRMMHGVDERERAAKLAELSAKSGESSGCVIC